MAIGLSAARNDCGSESIATASRWATASRDTCPLMSLKVTDSEGLNAEARRAPRGSRCARKDTAMRIIILTLLILISAAPKAIAQNVATLEGQVICCEDCWTRADRKTVPFGTRADLAKAAECVANGDPTLLAVTAADGTTNFYQLETGAFKKPGKNWLELVGSRVEVSGPTRMQKGKRFVRVNHLKVLVTPDKIASEPDVIGSETELVLKDLFGVEQKLSAYRGRIVVLNFWATWCGPCREEMPDLTAVQNQYAALGLQVIGAAADKLEDQKEVREFITTVKVNFPVWLGASTEDMSKFGLGPALPGTAIIGRDGRIIAVFPGVVKQAELRMQLDKLIARSQSDAERQIALERKAKRPEISSVPS